MCYCIYDLHFRTEISHILGVESRLKFLISYYGGFDKCPLHCYAMLCSLGPKGSAVRSSRHEHQIPRVSPHTASHVKIEPNANRESLRPRKNHYISNVWVNFPSSSLRPPTHFAVRSVPQLPLQQASPFACFDPSSIFLPLVSFSVF